MRRGTMPPSHEALSVFEDFGINESRCGYCERPGTTSVSHGMWAHTLTVEAYQVRSLREACRVVLAQHSFRLPHKGSPENGYRISRDTVST